MVIVIKEIPPSNNQYLGKTRHYSEYQDAKHRFHWLIKAAIKKRPARPYKRATVEITYYFPNRIRRDPDNYSGKFILDPLVREGVIEDDSFDHITLILNGKYDKTNPRTEIDIRGEDDGL